MSRKNMKETSLLRLEILKPAAQNHNIEQPLNRNFSEIENWMLLCKDCLEDIRKENCCKSQKLT
jgi:hypothetical protein